MDQGNKGAPPSVGAKAKAAVASLKAAALESALEADAASGMQQQGRGKFGSAREARLAKVAAARAKREGAGSGPGAAGEKK